MSWYTFIASDTLLDEYTYECFDYRHMLNIRKEKDIDLEYLAHYTQLPYIMEIELHNYEYFQYILMQYIKEAIMRCDELEIWSVWLNDLDNDILYGRCKDEDISKEDIAWILNQQFYEHPRCLKMYKWKRGKK